MIRKERERDGEGLWREAKKEEQWVSGKESCG